MLFMTQNIPEKQQIDRTTIDVIYNRLDFTIINKT